MIQNNLDPDVAERPEELIVYGGTGRAARSWRQRPIEVQNDLALGVAHSAQPQDLSGVPVPDCHEVIHDCPRLTYQLQRVGQDLPALSPEPVTLERLPLGQPPSLHRLRSPCCGVVRRLHRYYGRVRLPLAVHHRITGATLPMRTAQDGLSRTASQRISRFPCKTLPSMYGVSDRAEPRCTLRWRCPGVAFRFLLRRRRSELTISRLNTRPARSPVNASPSPLRAPTHDSGPRWIAIPFSYETLIHYVLPVSPAHSRLLRKSAQKIDTGDPSGYPPRHAGSR